VAEVVLALLVLKSQMDQQVVLVGQEQQMILQEVQ
jgi:hypothetical protein